MTSRERILAAITRKKADRVPLNYTATAEADQKLKDYLGVSTEEELRQRLGYDGFKTLGDFLGTAPYELKTKKPDSEDVRYDIWGVKRVRHYYSGGSYFEIAESPLERCETVAEIEAYAWPRIEDVVFKPIDAASPAWQEFKSQYVVLEMSLMGHFGIAWSMRGFQRFLEDLYLNPDIVACILTKIDEFLQQLADKFYQTYRGLVDAIGCGDDYSSQDGLLFSKELYRRYFQPLMARCYERAHREGAFAYKHNCGSVYQLIPRAPSMSREIEFPSQI